MNSHNKTALRIYIRLVLENKKTWRKHSKKEIILFHSLKLHITVMHVSEESKVISNFVCV